MIAMIFLFCCKEKKIILELLQKLISLHGSIFTNFYSLKKKKKILSPIVWEQIFIFAFCSFI